jgi:hypothetical protein
MSTPKETPQDMPEKYPKKQTVGPKMDYSSVEYPKPIKRPKKKGWKK